MKKNNEELDKPLSAGTDIGHSRQLPRLSRIEGQVRGLQKMIETDRNCLDLVHQISAVINALRRVQSDVLRDHLATLGEALIVDSISPKKRREMADELVALLKQLS